MSEVETFSQPNEVKHNETVETLHDGDYLAIIARLESSPVDEAAKDTFKNIFKAAIDDTRLTPENKRVNYVAAIVKSLHEEKSEYLKNRELDECPELHQVVIEMSYYLYKLMSDLQVQRALEHSHNIS